MRPASVRACWRGSRASLARSLARSLPQALIVRMLISSGVVIMFPLFYCIRRVGVDLDLEILTMSYPWLGRPVARLQREGKPVTPIIVAHCIRVVVLYSMYEVRTFRRASHIGLETHPSCSRFVPYLSPIT